MGIRSKAKNVPSDKLNINKGCIKLKQAVLYNTDLMYKTGLRPVPVAQLDRAFPSEGKGRAFESHQARI